MFGYNPYSTPHYQQQQQPQYSRYNPAAREMERQQLQLAREQEAYEERRRAYEAALIEEERLRRLRQQQYNQQFKPFRSTSPPTRFQREAARHPHPFSGFFDPPQDDDEEVEQEEQEEAAMEEDPQPEKSTAPSLPTHTLEEETEAASTIQSHYRAHRSVTHLSTLRTQFHTLKASFSLPPLIDFNTPNGIVTIPSNTPSSPETTTAQHKLAFSKNNNPIHAYSEALSRLLVALDGVESFGKPQVRERRKRLASAIEKEAGRVEGVVEGVWEGFVSGGRGEVEVVGESPAKDLATSVPATLEEPLLNTSAIAIDHPDVPVAGDAPEEPSLDTSAIAIGHPDAPVTEVPSQEPSLPEGPSLDPSAITLDHPDVPETEVPLREPSLPEAPFLNADSVVADAPVPVLEEPSGESSLSPPDPEAAPAPSPPEEVHGTDVQDGLQDAPVGKVSHPSEGDAPSSGSEAGEAEPIISALL